jgi:hypothetical protein
MKNNLEPIIDHLKESSTKYKVYPFTDNILSRATAKIIQNYQEKLTDMLLDDMLLEIVYILQSEENR